MGAAPKRHRRHRRSAREWVVRGGLALLVAIAGYVGVVHSFARLLAPGEAERAYRLAPWDGRVAALRAATLAGPEASPASRHAASQISRDALRRDPTAVIAVSTLGMNAQIGGDARAANRLFTYAERLSRRELQTQLWGIEDAVGRGDIAGALRHYDTALRTKPKASDLLFPILASASGDPAVRAALVRTLRDRPIWTDDFVRYLAAKGDDPRSSAQTLAALRRAGLVLPEDATSGMVNTLIAKGFTAEAWDYYRGLGRGADRRMSRDPRFTARVQTPSLFDWTPIGDSNVTTSIQRGARGGVFDFSASPGVGGALLQQVQVLPAGDYVIRGHSAGLDQAESDRPYWTIGCRGDGREIARLPLPNSSQDAGRFGGRFRVPADCPAQTLALMARPSGAIEGLFGQIDHVELRPAR